MCPTKVCFEAPPLQFFWRHAARPECGLTVTVAGIQAPAFVQQPAFLPQARIERATRGGGEQAEIGYTERGAAVNVCLGTRPAHRKRQDQDSCGIHGRELIEQLQREQFAQDANDIRTQPDTYHEGGNEHR